MNPKLAIKGMSTSTITNIFESTEKFDGENFYLWKFKIQLVLENKDLWGFVTGEEIEPKGPPEAQYKCLGDLEVFWTRFEFVN
ncbi:hypothetical protein K7432_016036 [Basidiobolus ranarum]|uniref:Retrotransposon Copia-like N-terminal domain-containing protein n=1 Tax=Basidiobolus ranarum TaxID=34480 RepID=A0ABR2WFB9_9FUNG